MKKFFLLIILAGLLSSSSFSQVNKDGLPFMKKYTDKDYNSVGQVWAITQDTRGVMYFGCNFGLKTFDGKNWKNYAVPNSTIIRSLASDDNGIVYYGAENDFGMIKPNKKGELEFYSFFLNFFPENTQAEFSSVWKTNIADGKIYFQAFEKVFYTELPIKINEEGKFLNTLEYIEPDKSPFHLSFSVNNKYYIREWEKGLCEIKDNKIQLIPGGEQFALMRVYAMLPYEETKILISTKDNGLFLYDTKKEKNAISQFKTNNDDLIKQSFIYSGTALAEGTFSFGTMYGGIIIINKKGEIINHFNKESGIPQQNILCSYVNPNDENSPLWFYNAEDGIYKINITNPFSEWSENMGLNPGPVMDAIKFNNILYVITGAGVYYLNELNDLPKFKLIGEVPQPWDLSVFEVKDTGEKKLLLGSFGGILEVKDTSLSIVAELQGARYLYQSKKNQSDLLIGSEGGLYKISYNEGVWSKPEPHKTVNSRVSHIHESEKFLSLGVNNGIYILDNFEDETIVKIDSARNLRQLGNDFFVHDYNGKLLIACGSGLYTINEEDTTAIPFPDFGKEYIDSTLGVYTFFEDKDAFWLNAFQTKMETPDFKLFRYLKGDELILDSVFANRLPKEVVYVVLPDDDYVWIGNDKGLYKFNKNNTKNFLAPFNTLISKVVTAHDSVLFFGNYFDVKDNVISVNLSQNIERIPILKYNSNKIYFEWASPFYELEEETEYSYRLIGETDKWSKWSKKSDTRFTNLFEGEYSFEVKARNIYNTESSIARYNFTVLPPWYRTIWAYIIFLVLGIFVIFLIIKLYTKKLKRENEKLEQTVKERTAEIRMQNEEITAQRDEIQEQKEQVEKSKDKIEKQQKSIMDSIHYASRIQEAVLPPDEYLHDIMGEYFVLFKPRDIVSGDFYWATQRGNKTVIVAADSTGHGVPGAFMSMLGISFLNEIVNKEEVLQANVILNRLRENVKRSLRQTGKENEAKDGMDIALCIIDTENMKLQFAGAYNPLYLLRDNEIQRVKADRMPIGIYLREKESFTNNIIDIQKGDLLYIFSDGYVDQFGGTNDQKIRSNKFKELLLENHKGSLEEQKDALVRFLDEWMDHKDKTGKKYKQVDDILVIGIEI